MRRTRPVRIAPIGGAVRLLAVAATVAFAAEAPPDLQAQELRGRVELPDSTPVANARVELHRVDERAGAVTDSTVSDATGRFVFALEPAADPGVVFLAAARYEGVLYWGAPMHAELAPDGADYVVSVFDTALVSGPTTPLQSTMRHVVITPGVTGFQVEEILDVEGLPDRTVVSTGGSGLVWQTELARGSRRLFPGPGGVPAEDLVLGEESIGFNGALPPSGIRVALQYTIPDLVYEVRLTHATERMELLVISRPGLDLRVDGLDEIPVDAEMSVPVRRFMGAGLPAGVTVSVRAEHRQPGRIGAWVWFFVALALASAALLSQRLTRPGR